MTAHSKETIAKQNRNGIPLPSRSGYDTCTGVRVIRMYINPVKLYDDGSVRCRARAELRASGQIDGECLNLARVINSASDIGPAFLELCREVAKRKGLKRVPTSWKKRNPPTFERFKSLSRSMRRDGYDLDGLALVNL